MVLCSTLLSLPGDHTRSSWPDRDESLSPKRHCNAGIKQTTILHDDVGDREQALIRNHANKRV